MINARNVPKRVAVNQSDPSVEARRWPPSRLKDMPLNTEVARQTQGKTLPILPHLPCCNFSRWPDDLVGLFEQSREFSLAERVRLRTMRRNECLVSGLWLPGRSFVTDCV